MTDGKLGQLVRALYFRTKSNILRWEPTADDDIYLASFTGYSVRAVRYNGRPIDDGIFSDEYRIEIYDDNDIRVETIYPTDIAQFRIQGEEDFYHPYQVFSELFAMARRQALGVDKAIDALLGELRANTPQSPDVTVADDKDEADDIPF